MGVERGEEAGVCVGEVEVVGLEGGEGGSGGGASGGGLWGW